MTSCGVQIMIKHCEEFSPFCHCEKRSDEAISIIICEIAATAFSDLAMTKKVGHHEIFSPVLSRYTLSCHCDLHSPPLLFPLPLIGGEGKGEGESPRCRTIECC